jgi:hypothetical protein
MTFQLFYVPRSISLHGRGHNGTYAPPRIISGAPVLLFRFGLELRDSLADGLQFFLKAFRLFLQKARLIRRRRIVVSGRRGVSRGLREIERGIPRRRSVASPAPASSPCSTATASPGDTTPSRAVYRPEPDVRRRTGSRLTPAESTPCSRSLTAWSCSIISWHLYHLLS